MPREFPRYLVTKEFGNTKSKGPFLIQTIYPKFIARIESENGHLPPYSLRILSVWDNGVSLDELTIQIKLGLNWVKANASKIKASF